MCLPDCTVHGVWVRSLVHDMFGRIAYKVTNRNDDGLTEFMIMWEPDEDMGTKNHTAGYALPETLIVRPYPPRPWANMPKEVRY